MQHTVIDKYIYILRTCIFLSEGRRSRGGSRFYRRYRINTRALCVQPGLRCVMSISIRKLVLMVDLAFRSPSNEGLHRLGLSLLFCAVYFRVGLQFPFERFVQLISNQEYFTFIISTSRKRIK